MSAAHELAERGFDAVVLERRRLAGGKARSIEVTADRLGPYPVNPRLSTLSTPWVPGEHGFRFFPGFYKHVIDTMSRIPTDDGRRVSDNLVLATNFAITQYDRRPMFTFPSRVPDTPEGVHEWIVGILEYFSPITDLHIEDLAFFAGKLWQILTSCEERRLAEYEKIPWWIFVGAETRSAAYRKFGAQGITRSVVAAKAESASTRTIGNTFVQMVLTLFDPLAPGDDRLLNGPTSAVWIDPWRRLLEQLGVDYRTHWEVTGIHASAGRISGVVAEHRSKRDVVEGDYYLCALPVERVAPLITPALTALDPTLGNLKELAENVEWMNGIQLYLRRDVPLAHGHVIHVDTEWALTSVSQAQFWQPGTLRRYADAEVNGIISVDISNWEAPGLRGRAARECSRQEVFEEVWAQLQKSLNGRGGDVLRDEDLSGWFLDPDIRPDPTARGQLTNTEALLVNQVDTWRLRPDASTSIPNFFLASDYVRTYTDLATMEGANEAARRAVNGILDASGSPCPRCQLWPLQEPPLLAPWREYDAARFRAGLPWDRTLLDAVTTAVRLIAPGFDRTTEVIAAMDGMSAASNGLQSLVRDRPTGRPVPASGVAPGGAGPAEGPVDFLGRLAWYRQETLDTISRDLPPDEPRRYLYDLINNFLNRPSKGLRPALCLATCRALGGDAAPVRPAAAGLELLHGAFLVHDDIEDDSELRSGQPAMHRAVGVPLALNAGDAMNALSMRLFRRSAAFLSPEGSHRLFNEVDHLLLESLEGQAIELGWRKENDSRIRTEDYLRLVLKKTGWYSFIHPIRIGALFADPDADLDRFNKFGYLLGAAFQVQDDILNLTGAVSRYGKEIGGDISEGKRTLIVTHALEHASPDERERLTSFFGLPGRSRLPRQVSFISDLLQSVGSIEWARQASADLASAARAEFADAFARAADGPDLDFLRSVADFVVQRDV
jgi:geranylgeranyl pyrophosphate synthase/uncharacterized protein with NAD-binding domain and iron-sulfur cluster